MYRIGWCNTGDGVTENTRCRACKILEPICCVERRTRRIRIRYGIERFRAGLYGHGVPAGNSMNTLFDGGLVDKIIKYVYAR